MGFIRSLYALHKMKVFSPRGLYHLMFAIIRYGTNVLALLFFASRMYRERVAVVDDGSTRTYSQMFSQSLKLAKIVQQNYQIGRGQKVALICRNHSSFVATIFALSGLGADVYLLNADMGLTQFTRITNHHDFPLLIYDESCSKLVQQSNYSKANVWIDRLLQESREGFPQTLRRTSMGSIVILTGGTTGEAKSIDDRIVSAGENVYPIEIEQMLLEHPDIEDAAVVGMADELFGERLRAFIVCSTHASLTTEELREWLQQRVARYHMPKEFVFVGAFTVYACRQGRQKAIERVEEFEMKLNVYGIIGIVLIIITAGVNVWGYFHLPETMATQFSLTSGKVNTMPKLWYLLISMVVVTFFTIRTIARSGEKRAQILTTIFGVIFTILNIVMIVMQV